MRLSLILFLIGQCNGQLGNCERTIDLHPESIWQKGGAAHSCIGDVRTDGARTCIDSNNITDMTSLYIDMSTLNNKIGCFEWTTGDCSFSMHKVSAITFTVEWNNCDSLWFAPLWTFSSPWISPQGTSGEIDLVEACPVPSVRTNLGCYSVSHGCKDAVPWGEGFSSYGPVDVTMTINNGNLDIKICKKGTCRQVASYVNYLNTVYPTRNGRDNPYKFISDIWNNRGGDGGWNGCRAVRNPNSSCRYAVTALKIMSKAPLFGRHSKCSALNVASEIGIEQ
jgi:hypothetical protein